MKFVIVLSVVAFALARDIGMKLEENGEKLAEGVKLDIAGQSEEINVPKHARSTGMKRIARSPTRIFEYTSCNWYYHLPKRPCPLELICKAWHGRHFTCRLLSHHRGWKCGGNYNLHMPFCCDLRCQR
eukprot:Seg2847.8 transcript_id=Seg2847.8/GoldUCD/mRNA.D3Y31 product="hypothetical protein" protein_id=Seg2847.8/GoldUCD/D3Y31